MNRKSIKNTVAIVAAAFGLLIIVSIATGYVRFVSVSKDSGNVVQDWRDLIQTYESAKTPEEKCKILNKIYGDDIKECLSEKLRLEF